MVISTDSVNAGFSVSKALFQTAKLIPRELKVEGGKDILDLGSNGAVSTKEAMGVVLERAMAKLKSVVEEARAALGIPEDAVIDTSPEATANRIADFALGAFEKWRSNDKSRLALADEDARKQFVEFIGAAVEQGIGEASDILNALGALSGEVQDNIAQTQSFIQQRFDDFILNG